MKWHVETVRFPANDVDLYGEILMPEGDGPFPAAVLCHGLASDHRSMRPSAQRLVRQGIATLAFDFRGHGKSSGTLDGNIRQDIMAAITLLKDYARIDRKKIAIVGHSMGAVAALNAASSVKDIRALAFLSGPADIGGFAELWKPLQLKAQGTGRNIFEFPKDGALPMTGWFNGLTFRLWMWIRKYRLRVNIEPQAKSWSNLDPVGSVRKLGNLPKLFVHCKGDKWVPYKETLELYEQAEFPKELFLSDRGFHVSPLLPGQLRKRWITWLVSNLK